MNSSLAQLSQKEVLQLRTEHKLHLSDTSYGYLSIEEIEHFEGLKYFDFDANYQVNAQFLKKKGKSFQMMTSGERRPWFRRYGYIIFEINNQECKLEVYQHLESKQSKDYDGSLFIPFRDQTSAKETYGGGRFMDIKIPDGKTILIDFNIAYNPYCAYSDRYSCSIPPVENTLKVEIRAGEMTPNGH